MIVPRYWAEGRAQHRRPGKQVTVRRFGWSDASQAEAQASADARAQEALQRVLSGEKLERREPKIPYNGAVGVPIREEIVDQQGETVITRNSYGARCLNTPDVLFVDIDFHSRLPLRLGFGVFGVLLVAVLAAIESDTCSRTQGIVLALLAVAMAVPLAKLLYFAYQQAGGGPERRAWARIDRFLENHPAWSLRVYRTPAGLRVMVTHATFSPNDPAVAECFKGFGADPLYARMCLNQQCFRARVTAKPWRIGIEGHLRPRPGVWPVNPERLPLRNAWIEKYETVAKGFAACTLVHTLGSGVVHPDVRPVQELHDALCQATTQLPIA